MHKRLGVTGISRGGVESAGMHDVIGAWDRLAPVLAGTRELLKRMYYITKRMAKTVAKDAPESQAKVELEA